MDYYFILGQNKNLSIAEVLNRPEIKGLKLSEKDVNLSDNVLFLSSKHEIDCEKLLKSLGGTIKIGEIREKVDNLNKINLKKILSLVKVDWGKIQFGFSVAGFKDKGFLPAGRQVVKNLAISLKKDLRKRGINSRWIEAKDSELSSVVVEKNNLIKKGGEIYIIKRGNNFYLGKTLAIQDFESYSKRDFGRPKRDVASGMIPPKLAQIMINLSGTEKDEVFLDPFCGSGTFLQEALLMGYKDIIGSDKSKKAIEDSEENLQWLGENYELQIMNYELINIEVKRLSEKIKPDSIDGIATEPYLGPTIRVESRGSKVESLVRELSRSYLETFREFKNVLKKGSRVVIIFPALKGERNLIHLNILNEIKKMGFEVANFVPSEFSNLVETTTRGSVLYSRPTPNQRVAREIFVFRKR